MVLSASKARSVTRPGRYSDSNGLHLFVTKAGRKSWVLRATVDGKRRDMGLGGFPDVSLTEARTRAARYRTAIADGTDPRKITDSNTTELDSDTPDEVFTVPTLKQATGAYFDLHSPNLRNGKHRRNWLQVLERHAFPTLGDRPVDSITGPDVLRVLTPIWVSRPPTARRVRQRLRSIFSWAVANGYASDNPAGEIIDGGLPKQAKRNNHFRAAPYSDVSEILGVVEASTANVAAKLAFRFLVLTAARSSEVRGATWDEIDWQAKTWTIPAERMKAGIEHRVPLSRAALNVLERARDLDNGSGVLFPSRQRRRKTLSDMTFSQLLRRLGLSERTTPHGMRTAFRMWSAEKTSASWAACEAALAHRVGDSVAQAYMRSDMLDERRGLMEAWGEYVTGTPG